MKMMILHKIYLAIFTSFLITSNQVKSHRRTGEISPPSSLSSSSDNQPECEPISVPLCTDMPYQLTRMPNFFRDTSQVEAMERSHPLEDLVRSGCSPHIYAYVCELLTPVCLAEAQEAMRRFEIYPCRSFCRRVKRDCELQLNRISERLFNQGRASLMASFTCESLPFESNGGNGTLRGPCHEVPDTLGPPPLAPVPPTSTAQSTPEPEVADPNAMRTNTLTTASDTSNNSLHLTVANQIQLIVQAGAIFLTKYSNAISIFTVLLLIIVLNTRRIRRLGSYLKLSNSSSNGSSSSSKLDGYPVSHLIGSSQKSGTKQHQSSNSLSPSSSSRSLMLIAALGANQPPTHKLLPADQTQQLFVRNFTNGTLEHVPASQRQRYLAMHQSQQQAGLIDKQHLFGSLDSRTSSNQYDYIQLAGQDQMAAQNNQQHQTNQMYSNILLSSPSHQVLLMNGGQPGPTFRGGAPPTGKQPPIPVNASGSPATPNRHAPYPSYTSPYASPLISQLDSSGASSIGGGQDLARSFQRRPSRARSQTQTHSSSSSSRQLR